MTPILILCVSDDLIDVVFMKPSKVGHRASECVVNIWSKLEMNYLSCLFIPGLSPADTPG